MINICALLLAHMQQGWLRERILFSVRAAWRAATSQQSPPTPPTGPTTTSPTSSSAFSIRTSCPPHPRRPPPQSRFHLPWDQTHLGQAWHNYPAHGIIFLSWLLLSREITFTKSAVGAAFHMGFLFLWDIKIFFWCIDFYTRIETSSMNSTYPSFAIPNPFIIYQPYVCVLSITAFPYSNWLDTLTYHKHFTNLGPNLRRKVWPILYSWLSYPVVDSLIGPNLMPVL